MRFAGPTFATSAKLDLDLLVQVLVQVEDIFLFRPLSCRCIVVAVAAAASSAPTASFSPAASAAAVLAVTASTAAAAAAKLSSL